MIQDLLKRDTGLFVHVVFTMSSEKEALLRKAAMLTAIDIQYQKDENIDYIASDYGGVIGDTDEMDIFGTLCWQKAYNMFLAQPPQRLTKTLICPKKAF
uniref:Uncharacterized protein n=1 Tax=Panagrolaimus superbus TaxID=310955 RepID=A0A914YF17_9BILA